ncbi:unnamed protein product [Caenorhabditis nigoni]|uniref:Phosphatidylinositol 4-kinase type 2 n=1 Tax=Caenorhabditis nigoni TaxID=1611254 RepID=A0A2G5TEK1_9PELO|nr:hypothetical protein B9Z55_018519 [Caenorhabditis nigoni]
MSANSSLSQVDLETDSSSIYDLTSSLEHRKKVDDEFQLVFRKAQDAINKGIQPSLIPEGSSGSYFVYGLEGEILGVFKPKDEEPFASLNPKWPKFFQRMLCFCCFGRACLIPNTGYLSEAAASIVSEMLQLDVVPTTRIVKLASPSFFYSRFFGHYDVRPKEGSFQLYVNGYESGNTVFARWNYDKNLLSEEEEAKFQLLFQKMCIVDYVIRNTDRHMDNLLVRHVPGHEINLAAIDNGLAFPVRHPECTSRFRSFPFRWSNLPWAQAEFDQTLRRHVLSLLTPQFVHRLCVDLKKLFRHGIASSNYMLVNSQLRVVRGQIWNLRQALIANESPCDMARRDPIIVSRSSDIEMRNPPPHRGMIGLLSSRLATPTNNSADVTNTKTAIEEEPKKVPEDDNLLINF